MFAHLSGKTRRGKKKRKPSSSCKEQGKKVWYNWDVYQVLIPAFHAVSPSHRSSERHWKANASDLGPKWSARRMLPPPTPPSGRVQPAVIARGCDVMWFVFRERRRCGLLRMESRFFILVSIPSGQTVRGERRAHENEFTWGCLQIRRISSRMLMDGIWVFGSSRPDSSVTEHLRAWSSKQPLLWEFFLFFINWSGLHLFKACFDSFFSNRVASDISLV